jgi:hypothetical protein
MNFFRQVQTAVNSIPQMGKQNNGRSNDHIVGLIRSCTYTDE